jgi:hypothetical protein
MGGLLMSSDLERFVESADADDAFTNWCADEPATPELRDVWEASPDFHGAFDLWMQAEADAITERIGERL